MSDSPKKLGRGHATVARHSKEEFREWGRRGQAARRERARQREAVTLVLQAGKDAFLQIAESPEKWLQWCFDQARKAKDYRAFYQMVNDAVDRVRGKAAQTHLVAFPGEIRLSDSELDKMRAIAEQVMRDNPQFLPPAKQCSVVGCGERREDDSQYCIKHQPIRTCPGCRSPIPEQARYCPMCGQAQQPLPQLPEPSAPATASVEPIRAAPDELLRANGVALPGHPETLPPEPRPDPKPRRQNYPQGPGNSRSH